MRLLGWVLMSGALAAGTAGGQEQPAASRDALRKLAFLEGEWEGDATVTGPGGPMRLRQTESVRYSNSGHALLIQGTGWEKDASGTERIAYNAVAVITHDPRAGYRMRSYLMEGRSGEFEVVPGDSGFTWGFEIPEGRIRYTMEITPAGEWHEVGEFIRGESPPRRTVEMRLRKKR